jgi:hypothetical protein
MRHTGHDHEPHGPPRHSGVRESSPNDQVPSLSRLAFAATVHCLTGCAIGEVLGMAVGTALSWSNSATVLLSVLLAFVFGYGLTMRPLFASGLATGAVLRLAFASDTVSITIMEIVDNARRNGRGSRHSALLGKSRPLTAGCRGDCVSSQPLVDLTRARACSAARAS